MSGPDLQDLARISHQLLHGVSLAVLTIAATILPSPLSLVPNLDVYRPLWP
jgi:hypothetical protein